jgi:CheY-like chemotaxis protein
MNAEREARAVLLVEADADERDRLGSWLEEEGFDVITCTGPTEPDYTCVGARAGACPLVEGASVVVLDMSTRSEGVMQGTAAEELLGLYLFAGARVVALASHPGEEIRGSLIRMRRHPEREDLLRAVRSLSDGETHPEALL